MENRGGRKVFLCKEKEEGIIMFVMVISFTKIIGVGNHFLYYINKILIDFSNACGMVHKVKLCSSR